MQVLCFVDGNMVDSASLAPASKDSCFSFTVKVFQSHLVDLLVHVYINGRLEGSRIFTKDTATEHLFEGRQLNLNCLERFRFKNYGSGHVTIKLYQGIILKEAKQVEQSFSEKSEVIQLSNQRCFDFQVSSFYPIQEIYIPLGTRIKNYAGYQVRDTYHFYDDERDDCKHHNGFKIKVKNPFKTS